MVHLRFCKWTPEGNTQCPNHVPVIYCLFGLCSTIQDLLVQLKFNLDIFDISTFAIYRTEGSDVRVCMYHELIKDVMEPTATISPTDSNGACTTKAPEIRLIFRSWIYVSNGVFEDEVHQHNSLSKLPTTALWLAYMEAVFYIMTGAYMLTEDESIILGCLKLQAETGDYQTSMHTTDYIQDRVSVRFPPPIRDRMKNLLAQRKAAEATSIATRIQSLYGRLVGNCRPLILFLFIFFTHVTVIL